MEEDTPRKVLKVLLFLSLGGFARKEIIRVLEFGRKEITRVFRYREVSATFLINIVESEVTAGLQREGGTISDSLARE